MFCLLADVEIRKKTSNRLGLQDAMRGVLAAGGNHEADWSIDRILSVADEAVSLDVLTRLHKEMGSKPVNPDIETLWLNLGVVARDGRIDLDDSAPLANLRTSITAHL